MGYALQKSKETPPTSLHSRLAHYTIVTNLTHTLTLVLGQGTGVVWYELKWVSLKFLTHPF